MKSGWVTPAVSPAVALADRRQDRRRYRFAVPGFSTLFISPRPRGGWVAKGQISSQARRFAKRRRISSLLGGPLAGNDGYENGRTRRRFAKGQIRARHEDSPKGGEFRAWHGFAAYAPAQDFRGWHGFAADTRLGIFERGNQFRKRRQGADGGLDPADSKRAWPWRW